MVKTSGRKHKPTPKKQANDYQKAMKAQQKSMKAKKKEISSKLKDDVDDLAGLFGSVAVGAKSANRELASGVSAVETGVGAVARGAENEMEKLTHMFSKQKFGGARRTRSKKRRYKKRTRSTKKR